MRNRTGTTILSLMIVCVLAALSVSAMAQGRHRGRFYTKAEVDRLIKRVEERSDVFKKHVDQSLDRGRLDGTEAEDRINEEVKELESAIDELRSEFDRRDKWQDVRENVQKVVKEGEDVNAVFRRRRLRPSVEAHWVSLRSEINRLAGIYNVRLIK